MPLQVVLLLCREPWDRLRHLGDPEWQEVLLREELVFKPLRIDVSYLLLLLLR
jgi:hypothetical protein